MKTWSMLCMIVVALIGCGRSETPKPDAKDSGAAESKESSAIELTQEEQDEIELNTFVTEMENSLAGEAGFMKPDSKKPGFMADQRRQLLEIQIARCTELIEKFPNERRLPPLLERATKALAELNARLPAKQESEASPTKEEGKAP